MGFVCVYILKKNKKQKTKNSKKKIQDFQIFPKKREKFSNEKRLWTRGIEPLSHLKKKIPWTRGIEHPSDFFLKA